MRPATARGPSVRRCSRRPGWACGSSLILEEDALALIRAHAYSHDQSVARSAHAVVSHELALSATPEQEIEST